MQIITIGEYDYGLIKGFIYNLKVLIKGLHPLPVSVGSIIHFHNGVSLAYRRSDTAYYFYAQCEPTNKSLSWVNKICELMDDYIEYGCFTRGARYLVEESS